MCTVQNASFTDVTGTDYSGKHIHCAAAIQLLNALFFLNRDSAPSVYEVPLSFRLLETTILLPVSDF